MVSKAYYEEKLQTALTAIQEEIERLNAETNKLASGDAAVSEAQRAELKERAQLIETKIADLNELESSLWQRLKEEVEDVLHRMGSGFENVAAANETDAVVSKKNHSD